MNKKRLIIGVIMGVVTIIVTFRLLYFLDSDAYWNFLIRWEEAFRPNWNSLTSGLSDREAFMKYIWPIKTFKDWPVTTLSVLSIMAITSWTIDNRSKNKQKFPYVNNFSDYLKMKFKGRTEPKDTLVFFAITFLFVEIVKQVNGFGFPYVYGPLFPILAVVFIVVFLVLDYRFYKNNGVLESQSGVSSD